MTDLARVLERIHDTLGRTCTVVGEDPLAAVERRRREAQEDVRDVDLGE